LPPGPVLESNDEKDHSAGQDALLPGRQDACRYDGNG
jgi:hypothetical protein